MKQVYYSRTGRAKGLYKVLGKSKHGAGRGSGGVHSRGAEKSIEGAVLSRVAFPQGPRRKGFWVEGAAEKGHRSRTMLGVGKAWDRRGRGGGNGHWKDKVGASLESFPQTEECGFYSMGNREPLEDFKWGF